MKFKEFITKAISKSMLRLVSVGIALILVVVVSIAQFSLDPTQFDFNQWLSNCTLLLGIQVIFMIFGEGAGKDNRERAIGGVYQIILKRYRETIELIKPYSTHFNDYHLAYREKELKRVIIQRLINSGISQGKDIYENLTINQIELLDTTPIEKNGKEFLLLTREQVVLVIYIIQNTKLGMTTPTYYLSEYGNNLSISDQDTPQSIERKIQTIKWASRAFKIIFGLGVSAIWAMFSVNDFMAGDDMQAWVNLISRIFSAFSGFFTGWLTAVSINYQLTHKLEDKEQFLNKFYLSITNGEFKPLDIHEKFVKQVEEIEKRQDGYEILKQDEPIQIELKKE